MNDDESCFTKHYSSLWFITVLLILLTLGNQTWQLNIHSIHWVFNRNFTYTWRIFQHAMFDYQRVYPCIS